MSSFRFKKFSQPSLQPPAPKPAPTVPSQPVGMATTSSKASQPSSLSKSAAVSESCNEHGHYLVQYRR